MTTQTSREEYFATHAATDKQIGFISGLLKNLADLGHVEEARDLYRAYAEQAKNGDFTIAIASNRITELKSLVALGRESQAKEQASIVWPEVPTGRYAYAKSEDPEDLAFFHVVVKEDGYPLLWAYSSDDEVPIRGNKQKQTILQKIVDLDPFQCELLFGQKMGYCSRCGKKLTRTESRDRGMGDKCAGKVR